MKKKILVVDDDKVILFAVKKLLEEKYSIFMIKSGRLVHEVLKVNSLDLILLDVQMPEMDGFQVMEEMKKSGCHTPVVFLSADQCDETKMKCFHSGAVDFIGKPFHAEVFLQRIDDILEREEHKKKTENQCCHAVENKLAAVEL